MRHDRASGIRIQIENTDIETLREQLIAPKFNFAAPHVRAVELSNDGSLILCHDHATDGRGLDLERAQKVLEYIALVWRDRKSVVSGQSVYVRVDLGGGRIMKKK